MNLANQIQKLAKLVEARAKFKIHRMETIKGGRQIYVLGLLYLDRPIDFEYPIEGWGKDKEFGKLVHDQYGHVLLSASLDYLIDNADEEITIEPELDWSHQSKDAVGADLNKNDPKQLTVNFILDNPDQIYIG